MNRTIALVALLSLIVISAAAQPGRTNPKTDNTKVLPVNPTVDPADSVIESKLVELAITSPAYKASVHQNKITELGLRKVKNSWLNLLSVSYSANDQTFNKPASTTNTYVYPKYNVGVTVPLGIIFSQGNEVKSARESLANSKELQEELSRDIKADILAKYKQYKLYTVLIEMQAELINDVVASATQAEDNFKKGTISVDVYINTQKSKNEESAKILNLKLQQDILKLEIEKIIGVPLEGVLHPTPLNK